MLNLESPFISSLLKKFFFFDVEHFRSLYRTFYKYCFCFMFWLFGHEACGVIGPWPRIESTPPTLESEILTPGPPEKSLFLLFYLLGCFYSVLSWIHDWSCHFLYGLNSRKKFPAKVTISYLKYLLFSEFTMAPTLTVDNLNSSFHSRLSLWI